MGRRFKDALHLTSFQQALVVAVPVVVGSPGRIPVGVPTDGFGGRIMFPAVSAATIVPVLYLGLTGQSSPAGLPVGVPFVNSWFPPGRRGLALGVFGVGMGGTAISALTTVHLVTADGSATPFVLTAIVLAGYAVLAGPVLREAPRRRRTGCPHPQIPCAFASWSWKSRRRHCLA